MPKDPEQSVCSSSAAVRDLVLGSLEETKGKSICVLDVSDRTSVTDLMIIASGTSSRHVRSLADNVLRSCRDEGIQPLGVEGQSQGEWVLVDLGDVVVHLMMPSTRQFYDLERLWETSASPLVAEAR